MMGTTKAPYSCDGCGKLKTDCQSMTVNGHDADMCGECRQESKWCEDCGELVRPVGRCACPPVREEDVHPLPPGHVPA